MRLVGGVLIGLVLLVSTSPLLATGAAWRSKWVGVYDYTSAEWRPLVESTVAEFNAVLPARAPTLLYHAMTETSCSEIGPQLHRGGIVVCTVPSLPPPGELGTTDFWVSKGQLSRVRITLSATGDPEARDNTVCHEFMHATTGIPDHYDALPTTSCVWGDLNAPGSFDAQYAHRAYKPQAKKQANGKPHTGKRHGDKRHHAGRGR